MDPVARYQVTIQGPGMTLLLGTFPLRRGENVAWTVADAVLVDSIHVNVLDAAPPQVAALPDEPSALALIEQLRAKIVELEAKIAAREDADT